MPAGDWDLTAFFPAIDHPSYREFRAALGRDAEALIATLDVLPAVAAAPAAWASPLATLEELGARLGHLESYLHCVASADAADPDAPRELASLDAVATAMEKAGVAVRAAFAAADEPAMTALLAEPVLAGAAHHLQRVRQDTRYMMPPALEGLAADLAPTAMSAWGRLYDQLSGELRFELARPGLPTETHPVAMTRTFLEDADPVIRRAALEGANRAWASVATSTAAALNAISGTRLALYRRRGVPHYLEPACFAAGITRTTLDAMMTAVRSRQELARRYLRAKARKLGLPRLGFCDLMAALPRAGGGDDRVTWPQALAQIDGAFGASYPALATFARHAIAQRWVDFTARDGKRPGGFCTSSQLLGESRIFLTFHGALGDAQTMSHELGHAFHNWVMRDLRSWQRGYPMTLAETASTFAEELVLGARLADPGLGADDRLALLDARLDGASAFLLNIPMRFDFECALYEARAGGELSGAQLGDLMRAAQLRNFGDVLDPAQLDPWFWSSKLHFFITEISFYNFPYTFGYLFSRAIGARFRAEGAAFLPRYEALLRDTGSMPAEEVARRHLGADLGSSTFWTDAIDSLEPDLRVYEGA